MMQFFPSAQFLKSGFHFQCTHTHISRSTFLIVLYFISLSTTAVNRESQQDAAKFITVFVTFLFNYMHLLCTLVEN